MKEDQSYSMMSETYVNFGERAFWIFLFKKLSPSFGFLVISAALLIVRASSLVPGQYLRFAGYVSIGIWAAFFLSAIYAFAAARFEYRNNAFCFAPDAFKVRRGVFTKIEMAIPYRQIQNVEIERTLSQQIGGVSRVVITTAGTDNPNTVRDESSCVLESVDREVAEGLQDELLRRADVQKVKSIK